MADKAVEWLQRHQAFSPDKPFLMYWAPGAAHGPHHIFKAWADKYKGRFDDGWDAMRERISRARRSSVGSLPTRNLRRGPHPWRRGTASPRRSGPFSGAAWKCLPVLSSTWMPRRARSSTDSTTRIARQHHRLLYLGRQRLQRRGSTWQYQRAAGPDQIPNTIQQQIKALEQLGGLDALGSPRRTTCIMPAGPGPVTRRSSTPS